MGDKSRSNGFIHCADAFWAHYLQNADRHDKNLTDTLKGDTDGILIFTGLFAATVATFIAESLSWLQPDSQDKTNALLSQISLQIATMSNGTAPFATPLTSSTAPFQAPTYAVVVNALWFLSLLFSVLSALCATLVQQWTRTYFHAAQLDSSPHIRGPQHVKLSFGLRRFRLRLCVDLIVTLIHVAVSLFLAGLVVVLYNRNSLLMCIFLGFSAGAATLYLLLSVAPLVFDDAPFRTPLTPLLDFLYTLHFTFQRPVVGSVLREIQRLWSFRRFPMPEVSTKIDVHLLRLRRAIDLSLRTVDQNRELESFTEALPGLIEATHSTRDAHDIVSYLLGQNLFGRLCQSLRSVYDPYRTSPDSYSEVRRTLSSITTFRLLVEQSMGPDTLLFPSVDSTPQHQSQTRHGLGVLNRLASSEDPEWALHASCTLASMTATLLRVYAHVREPFDTTEHGLGVLRRLLRYSEAMLDQEHYTPHLNPLGGGLTSEFEDTLEGDGRLCNLLAFVSRISPHLPHLSQEDSAIAWKCMAGLEPETMDMARASRWLVARFHETWLELQDRVDGHSTSSDQDVMGVTSLQILREYLRPLAASIDLSRIPCIPVAATRH